MSVVIKELGIRPETQLGLWRAEYRLRQAINELEHAAETVRASDAGRDQCLEALQAAQEALFLTHWSGRA